MEIQAFNGTYLTVGGRFTANGNGQVGVGWDFKGGNFGIAALRLGNDNGTNLQRLRMDGTATTPGWIDVDATNTMNLVSPGAITMAASAVNIPGATGGGNPGAGYVGEIRKSTVARGSAIALGNSPTISTVASVSLPAGNWDVCGTVELATTGAPSVNFVQASIETAGNAVNDAPDGFTSQVFAAINPFTYASPVTLNVSCRRVNPTATTVYHLNVHASFSSTMNAYGGIKATRMP
jgi:hypothetical protein